MKQLKTLIAIFISAGLIVFFCAPRIVYNAKASKVLVKDSLKSAYCIPLKKIKVLQHNGNLGAPDTLLCDSFFLEAANGLLLYEISRYYSIMPLEQTAPKESGNALWELCNKIHSVSDAQLSNSVKAIALQTGADVIVIPLHCSIRQTTIKRNGWRDGKYKSNYGTPVSYAAETRFLVQVWSSDGVRLYEHTGIGTTGRPVSYSIIERVDTDTNGRTNTPYFYAPILVKALNEAIVTSLNGGIQ